MILFLNAAFNYVGKSISIITDVLFSSGPQLTGLLGKRYTFQNCWSTKLDLRVAYPLSLRDTLLFREFKNLQIIKIKTCGTYVP